MNKEKNELRGYEQFGWEDGKKWLRLPSWARGVWDEHT